jgi:UDP-glucose 4-epimerase
LNDKHSMILVTGATGAVGPHIIMALHAAGYQVRTLSLDNPPHDIWPNDVDVRIGDVTNPVDVQSAMQEIEGVIHLAALLHIVDPPVSLRGMYERVNVHGTESVVNAAVEAGVSRLVFFSTITVYGDSAGRILTEDTPPKPETFYAQTKYKAEQIVLAAKQSDGQPLGTALRLGAVYGARIKGNYRKLLLALSKGRFIPIGDGKNRRTMVYDKDVAQAAVLALSHPSAAGKIYNVSDGRFHAMDEIIGAMCRALGKPLPKFSLSAGSARLIAGLLEDGARVLGMQSPIGRSTIDKYTEDIAVDSQRIQAHLGFASKYDLESGWRETVEHMRSLREL